MAKKKKGISRLKQMAQQQRKRKQKQKPQGFFLPPPGQPMEVAREFVKQCMVSNGVETVRRWRGGWWLWQGSRWREVDAPEMRSALYRFTENAMYWKPAKNKLLPPEATKWAPNRYKITDLLEALSAVVILHNDINQPCWLDGRNSGTIVACANGLLDIDSGQLLMHSPQYFNGTAVPFNYDPAAPQPVEWLAFLNKLWPSENGEVRPEIAALGEWYGYVISGRLDLHKALLMVGPTRGGKGIIARILGALIGEENVAGPTLSSLGGEFGLAPLLGKSLAVLSDTRSGRHNSAIVVERLLSISGEDTLTVNRKYRDQWTGKLPCRLHIVSNELPKLDDASSAIVGRLVILPLSYSWLGQEDHGLERKLRQELPSILNWALEGLHRLTATNRNQFTVVKAADDAVRQMRDLASPIRAFVREECEFDSAYEVDVDNLYRTFQLWCENNGHSKSSKQLFGRDLRAAYPSLTMKRTRKGDERYRVYVGIRKRTPGASEEEEES